MAAVAGLALGIAVQQEEEPAAAASGGGDQGPLMLGSNRFFVAPATFSNTPNVSSVATVVEASPNFGNFTQAAGAHVFKVDATPAGNTKVNGIEGYGTGGGYGVRGVSSGGIGVVGEGGSGIGVLGASTGSPGVYASSSDVGGLFQGTKAPLRLVPAESTQGSPSTGTHQTGELYVDGAGALYYCAADGSPGMWVTLFAASAPSVISVFQALPTPERFVDTRRNLGGVQGPLPESTTSTFQMTGRNGQSGDPALRIPDTATTVVGNLTVVGGATIPVGSFVTLWPDGPQPTVSNIYVGPGAVVATSYIVALGASGGHGHVNVFNQHECDYILDVTGYYTPQ